MEQEKIEQFKQLFREHCRESIDSERCDGERDCEFCYVGAAWDQIFCENTESEDDE